MKPLIVKHNWNSDEFPKQYEVNTMSSRTVPDEAFTIRELLEKFVSSGKIDLPESSGNFTALDDQDFEVLPLPNTMDFVDQQNLVADLQQEISDVKKAWEASKAATEGTDSQSSS